MTEPIPFPKREQSALSNPGVGRDASNAKSLCFYFSRPVTDDEMRFPHDVMQRACACMPEGR